MKARVPATTVTGWSRAVVLAVVASLTLAACTDTAEDPPDEGNGDASGSVTIGFAATTASAQEDEMWQSIVDAFNASQDEIVVEPQLIPDQNFSKLRIMVQTGSAEDVMQISDDDTYTLGPGFEPIDDLIGTDLTEDDISPVAWSTFAVGEAPKFITPVLRVTLAAYNKDLFDEAGIEAPATWDDAWEWDEFVSAMETLTMDTDGDGTIDQWGFGHAFSYAVLWPYSNGSGGPYNEDQTMCTMDSPEIVEIFDEFARLRLEDGIVAQETASNDIFQLFNAGRIAMVFGGGGEASRIAEDVNWGVTPLPKAKVSSPTESFGRPFGVSSDSENPEAAKQFLAYLLSEEAQNIMVDVGYGVPANRASLEYFTEAGSQADNAGLYIEAIERDVDLQNVNPLGEEWVERFVRTGAAEVLTGQRSAEEMLSENCTAMNDLIAEIGWVKP